MNIAKFFQHPSGVQVVVIRDEGDDMAPRISVLVQPAGLGICAERFIYPNTDYGHELRDRMFEEKFSEKETLFLASKILDCASDLVGNPLGA